ncbi:MAG TPA: hypothetical protein VHZ32_14365 [Rhizomicrobium sp.]|jgi:hypothetical protein|nr:hypothetical protein [Rhizomicrobium sp.]
MSRKAALIIASLMFSSSIAWADPALTPGKPAGVRQAQAISIGTIGVSALVLIAVAGYAISTPPYHIPGTPSVTASTSTQP